MTLSRQIEQRFIDWITGSENEIDATVCREINADKLPLPVVTVSCDIGDQLNTVHRDTFNCSVTIRCRAHAGDSGDTDQCEAITDAVEFIVSDNDQGLVNVEEALRYDFAGTSFEWDESVMVGEIKVMLIARRVI